MAKKRIVAVARFVVVLTAASAYQLVFGSEPYTGLTKRSLHKDLPQALAIGPDGILFVVATNNLRDGEPTQDTGR